VISYEEYHPYGTTAFQYQDAGVKAVAKRYRYTGKERDEESGLYYHGARYYIPWLARWSAVDPLESKYAGMSPYNYGNCNPVRYNDPSGMSGEDHQEGERQLTYTYSTHHDADGTSREVNVNVSFWHRGDEKNKAGWYSEESYSAMTKEAMTGMLHALAPYSHGTKDKPSGFTLNTVFHGDEALQKADAAALKFIQANKGHFSEDFFQLLSKNAPEIIKKHNWAYGGTQTGVVYLTDSPIDYVAGGVVGSPENCPF